MARVPASPAKRSSGDDAASSTGRWHAVEIRCGPRSCEAVRAAAGRRYLPGEAPPLPLAECDCAARCECRYRHHEDRRARARRADDGPFAPPAVQRQDERRQAEDRRRRDREHWTGEENVSPSDLDDTYYDYVSKTKLYD